MAKDYAKKTKKSKSASRFDKEKPNKTVPRWIWIITVLLLGFAIAYVAYLQLYIPRQTPAVTVEKKETIKSAKSRYHAVPAEESDDSDFSFHGVLENKVVETPVETPKERKPTASNKRYIMQCGSFRKVASAENLKAQIAMNGFSAKINATKEKSGNRWYRVALGPYSSKRQAEKERHQLERNNINNCRIW